MAIQMYKLIHEYMNIFINHLHGDTLFTAFSFSAPSKHGYHYTCINTKTTFTIAKSKQQSLRTRFYFQGMSDSLGVKGII